MGVCKLNNKNILKIDIFDNCWWFSTTFQIYQKFLRVLIEKLWASSDGLQPFLNKYNLRSQKSPQGWWLPIPTCWIVLKNVVQKRVKELNLLLEGRISWTKLGVYCFINVLKNSLLKVSIASQLYFKLSFWTLWIISNDLQSKAHRFNCS